VKEKRETLASKSPEKKKKGALYTNTSRNEGRGKGKKILESGLIKEYLLSPTREGKGDGRKNFILHLRRLRGEKGGRKKKGRERLLSSGESAPSIAKGGKKGKGGKTDVSPF